MNLRFLLISCLLLMTGCGGIDLNTDYGTMEPDGVNGVSVLHGIWTERFDARSPTVSGDDIDEFDTLLFIERDSTGLFRDLDVETTEWLDNWLLTGDRQLVLLLKDGHMSHWLIQNWIDELKQVKALVDPKDPNLERFDQQIAELEELIADEHPEHPERPGERSETPWFSLLGITPKRSLFSRGSIAGPTPPFFAPARSIEANEDYQLQSLMTDEHGTYIAEVDVLGSRIIVVSDSTLFLNAGLVDRRARALADKLGDHIAERDVGKAAWIRRIRYLPKIPPPNTLGLLFTKPPWNIAFFHFVGFLLLYLWFRAAWLGRISARNDHQLEHFGRHLEALGLKLRQNDARQTGLSAIGKYHKRKAPAAAHETEGLLRQSRNLYEEAGSGPHSPPTAPTAASPPEDT